MALINSLRNPLVINDITNIFERDDVTFDIFKKNVKGLCRKMYCYKKHKG